MSDRIEHANDIIRKLMKERNETQTQIAHDVLDIQQSNFSAALNPNNSRQLTLDQFIDLADYYDLSLDSLFGREKNGKTNVISARSICEIIMYLIKTKRAIIRDVTIYEKDLTTTPTDDYDGFFSSREIRPTEYTYSALLFPNYDNTSDSYKYQLNKIERQHGGIYVNEDYVNESINTFLKKFIELEDFKKKSGLPEDIYNLAISDYLSKVSSEPYISMDEKIRANEERINKHFDETIDFILSSSEDDDENDE